MNKRTLALALACALSLSMLAACGGNDENTPAPAPEVPEQSEPATPETEQPEVEQPEVEMPFDLSHTDVTLNKADETFTLTTSQPDAKVYFGSDNEAVAIVDAFGVVTAIAPGTATIMVENEAGQTASCIVRCDWKVVEELPGQKPEAPSATGVDLNEFYYTTYDALFPLDADGNPTGPFTDNIAASMPEALDAYYPGLSDIKLNQCLDFIPMMTGVPFEIVLIEVADSADVAAVKQILENRIETEKNNHMAYPAITENWVRNSRIVVEGNYIMMAVCETCEDFVDAFKALF